MKKQLRITLGIVLSVMLLVAFAGCGDSEDSGTRSAQTSPADDAVAALDTTLAALKAAVDKTAEEEDGMLTTDVTISMLLEDGQWTIQDPEGAVMEAITGGFMTAISQLAQ